MSGEENKVSDKVAVAAPYHACDFEVGNHDRARYAYGWFCGSYTRSLCYYYSNPGLARFDRILFASVLILPLPMFEPRL
ncbi:uncharacterized protein PHALS_14308 [Plasmopara halstedii]|uniref:Uncharacterized protein n=1 Tax=Plasmopara halstedii TaxID=4781 RepID=A0A0P1AR15_PLAHL|nr:uncharacterized protein PHALS_14308 [Plasmopara halstedii]CEG44038.1 hypothetical protein PHALS_14308 [Plasmopara halstedii]|eukprot:XP_024580407.1 hypothetical protein PHALS_14308 [Plasmopara halstedii]